MKWSVGERRSLSAEVPIMSETEIVEEAVEEVEEVRPIAGIGTLVFGKWDASASGAFNTWSGLL